MKFRVAEVFGPTIQGEGRRIGTPCYFIRFGGCDYRCSWCDTPHAVLPDQVAQLPQLTPSEIADAVEALPRGPEWVVLSGGNPVLFDLEEVVKEILARRFHMQFMVETQGSIWKEWLWKIEDVCVSPKPPSSGNITTLTTIREFLDHFNAHPFPYLKVVVFDDADYEYATLVHQEFPYYEFFLSVGNEDPTLPTVGNPDPPSANMPGLTQDIVLAKMRWLMEKVAVDPYMKKVRVLPQMHTLAWGNARGH
jgi:7-carboxy-7-deazaguanine synthase